MPIDQVLGSSAEDDLSGDADGRIFLETDRRLLLVAIIEDNCDAGFRYTSLPALVDEILVLLLAERA